MCKKNFFNEMKTKRGYAEMKLLLRRTNIGYSSSADYGVVLLEIAIMSYLTNPEQTLKDILEFVEENCPMPIGDGDTAFQMMKETLQNVCINTDNCKKLEKDEIVMKYIRSAVANIRIDIFLQLKIAEEELNVSVEDKDNLIAVCQRKLLNPKDTIKEILNYVSGGKKYPDIEILIESIIKYLNLSEEEKENLLEEQKIELIEKLVDSILKEKDTLVF